MGWLIGQDEPDIVWAGPEWISMQEASEILETDTQGVQDLIRKRVLSAVKINNEICIYAKSIYIALSEMPSIASLEPHTEIRAFP